MQQAPFTTAYTQPGPPIYELSGWWRRAGAELIDGFLVWIPASIISSALDASTEFSSGDEVDVASLIISAIVYFTISIPVMAGIMTYSNGQTLGMMATSIRVVREDGEKIKFGFAVYRENIIKELVFGWLAAFTLYIATLLNYLWPLWDDNNQALHDKICKTRVVRDSYVHPVEQFVATAPPPPPAPPPAPGEYQPPPGFENPVPEDRR